MAFSAGSSIRKALAAAVAGDGMGTGTVGGRGGVGCAALVVAAFESLFLLDLDDAAEAFVLPFLSLSFFLKILRNIFCLICVGTFKRVAVDGGCEGRQV